MDREALVEFAGDGRLNTDLDPQVMLRAPKAAYTAERGRGWSNLSDMLRVQTVPVLDNDPEGSWARDAQHFSSALASYLRAESIRAESGQETISREAVLAYLDAYDHAPGFAPARGMLYLAAARSSDLAGLIFPRMLASSPEERRVYRAYLEHLRRTGDHARFDEINGGSPGAIRQVAEAALEPNSRPHPETRDPGDRQSP